MSAGLKTDCLCRQLFLERFFYFVPWFLWVMNLGTQQPKGLTFLCVGQRLEPCVDAFVHKPVARLRHHPQPLHMLALQFSLCREHPASVEVQHSHFRYTQLCNILPRARVMRGVLRKMQSHLPTSKSYLQASNLVRLAILMLPVSEMPFFSFKLSEEACLQMHSLTYISS